MNRLLVVCLTLMLPAAAFAQDDRADQSSSEPDSRPLGYWVKALKDKNRDARRQAVQALARMGPGAKSAVNDLIEAMADKDYIVRAGAASALGAIGPEAK